MSQRHTLHLATHTAKEKTFHSGRLLQKQLLIIFENLLTYKKQESLQANNLD